MAVIRQNEGGSWRFSADLSEGISFQIVSSVRNFAVVGQVGPVGLGIA
jgi:hypothetical protein